MTARLTQSEFARLRGVNRSTVHRWLANGRIQADERGMIDPAAAALSLDATESPLPHHQARKAQFDEARAGHGINQAEKTQHGPAAPHEPVPAIEKIGAALKLETYKLQKAKAERENMELDKLAGALVERAEVELVLADFGATLRGLLENLPTRLHAVHQGDHQKITEIECVAADLLNEIVDHMHRKMETA